MNKVGGAAPLSRGRVDEALAAIPLLRSPTCSGHSRATLLRPPSSNKAFANACGGRRSVAVNEDWPPRALAVISSLYVITFVFGRDEAS